MRELRQHASRYLARVRAGETIEVTDRGRAVARLVPVVGESWQDLLDGGQVIPAADPTVDVSSLEPLELGFAPSAELERLRDEER